jgi:hypothetical protein
MKIHAKPRYNLVHCFLCEHGEISLSVVYILTDFNDTSEELGARL